MPFIYAMIIPLALLDAFLAVYHRICFPLYGISLVKRSHYLRFDRHKLAYLTPLEKINCTYCGYANGLIQYAARIAGETERYWCGIRHKQGGGFVNPPHHKDFVPYGDVKAFEKRY